MTAPRSLTTRVFVALVLAVAIGLAAAVSPFASGSPDGLNRVAEDKGFSSTGRLAAIQEDAPIEGYAFPGIENERVAKGLAGFLGAVGVFAAGSGLALVVGRDRGVRPSARSASTPSS